MSLKTTIISLFFLFLISTQAPGLGLHGNNFSASTGVLRGDTDLEEDADSAWIFSAAGSHFVSESIYFLGGYSRTHETFNLNDADIDIIWNIIQFGAGYEHSLSSLVAIFAEGTVVTGDGRNEIITDTGKTGRMSLSQSGYRARIGARGIEGRMFWEVHADYAELTVRNEDRDWSGNLEAEGAGANLTWPITENARIGGQVVTTDFDAHSLAAVYRYYY